MIADDAAPVVSVVIPTCNRSDQMRRCLHALAKQTQPNFEVIVIDDGSTDDTQAMIARMSRDHAALQLRYLRNDGNIGANPSRNRGVAAARGDFIAFLDSDCVAEPDWLEMLLRAFTDWRVAAVTGLVIDNPPANIYELTFKGSHRLDHRGPAHRLVAGNMCVRRDLLLRVALDEDRAQREPGLLDLTVSGRGDEEGLFLMLQAEGLSMMTAPDAVVLHDHGYTRRSFFKQALRGGRSAARLVYKYYLPQRLDMLPFILAYMTLPLPLWSMTMGMVPLMFFAAACAGLLFNELFRKGKSITETLRVFPVQLAYYHVRLAGYVHESFRLRLRRNDIVRVRLARRSPIATTSKAS